MINQSYRQNTEIDLKDLFWKLLTQWKAILIVSLLMAALVCGAKHYRSVKAYNAKIEAEKAQASQSELSVDDKVEEILGKLPSEEKVRIEYLVHEQEWLNAQKKYLEESLLMRTDPSNQRALSLVFEIEAENAEDTPLLMNNYLTYLKSGKFAEDIKPFISEKAKTKYVSELIQNSVDDAEQYEDYDVDKASGRKSVVSAIIILTDDADAEKVAKAAEDSIKDFSSTQKTVHSVKNIHLEEKVFYSKENNDRMKDVFYAINLLEGNLSTSKKSLTSAQKNTIDSILSLRAAENTADETSEEAGAPQDDEANTPAKPGYSKKYALMGFVLGALMYAFIYLLLVILRGRVESADAAERCTGSRLVGEIYHMEKQRGFQALFHSKFVDKLRYGDKLDTDRQLKKMLSSIEGVCEHKGVDRITLLDVTCAGEQLRQLLEETVRRASERDISIDIVDVAEELEEKAFNSIKHAVVAVSGKTKTQSLLDIANLCCNYNVDKIGSTYWNEL